MRNPGLITIPLSFLVGIAVSLASREPEAERRCAEVEARIHFGEADEADTMEPQKP